MKIFRVLPYIALLAQPVAAFSQEAPAPSEDQPVSIESGAERVARMERIVQSDKVRLAALAQDLKERGDSFARTSADVERRNAELVELRARLEKATDPDAAAKLKEAIAAAEEKYELVKPCATSGESGPWTDSDARTEDWH